MASVSPTATCAGAPVARLGRRAWPRVQERTGEFIARAFISSLFVVLATSVASEFLRTGHVTKLFHSPLSGASEKQDEDGDSQFYGAMSYDSATDRV